MIHINDFFQSVRVLHMPDRYDRLIHIEKELEKEGIKHRFFAPIPNDDAEISFNLSFIEMMKHALSAGENLLVIEDDCIFSPDFARVVDKSLQELPANYEMIYFGGNVYHFKIKPYSDYLVRAHGVWTTHCVGFSKRGMEQIVKRFNPERDLILDNWMRLVIHPRGFTYIVKPIVAEQIASYSDLNKAEVDYWQAWEITKNRMREL